ncbi:hypothetical protein DFH07DRAFT_770158 [Mycena maculata]|uniref:Uncharacterized protein n=1 Tax=Mycena maculata TaxID=230809 RepID=A0AAD7JLM9_9AGAR|nr:hypothetical protein DFH07DRAFT_770158 [Mycena maculata]
MLEWANQRYIPRLKTSDFKMESPKSSAFLTLGEVPETKEVEDEGEGGSAVPPTDLRHMEGQPVDDEAQPPPNPFLQAANEKSSKGSVAITGSPGIGMSLLSNLIAVLIFL